MRPVKNLFLSFPRLVTTGIFNSEDLNDISSTMRLVVQKVAHASVTSMIEEQAPVTATIGRGLMVLVGFEKGDTIDDMRAMCKSLLKLRFFQSKDDPPKPNTHSLSDAGVDLLLVSQFTLTAQLKSGRPSFHRAMDASDANGFYNQFVDLCRQGLPERCCVETGIFGAKMHVHLLNEGPFTVCLSCRDGKCDTW